MQENLKIERRSNFTIIVNWKARGFGCRKVCSYCTWRDSPYLPHGPQSSDAIVRFLSQCQKSFVTISGGADPLYKFEENQVHLLDMISTIRQQGYMVRVITREIEHVAKLKGLVDCVSISLDAEVLEGLPHYVDTWKGMHIECSLVLPPLPTESLLTLQPQYRAIYHQLNQMGQAGTWCKLLVLRENLNSIFKLDMAKLSFSHAGIALVSRATCLNGRYLTTECSAGHTLIQDNANLASYLMSQADLVLFGGFVKHVINPVLHDYDDIDLIALNYPALQKIERLFGYQFKEVSASTSYPRYFIGKSSKAGKTLQVILLNSKAEAMQFVHHAQYDVDRVALSQGEFYFDQAVGEAAVRNAIATKHVRRIPSEKRFWLFHQDRVQIEKKHQIKLVKKGFSIIE